MNKSFRATVLGAAVIMVMTGGGLHLAAKEPAKTKAKPAAKPCVALVNVIKGCSACEAMQQWLRAGGVELDVTNVEHGKYKLYPTVVYSDKTVDHGERMYKQQVTIPEKLCVVSCSVGIE
jgi:hypothetical protein